MTQLIAQELCQQLGSERLPFVIRAIRRLDKVLAAEKGKLTPAGSGA
jgi:hypothetical protein